MISIDGRANVWRTVKVVLNDNKIDCLSFLISFYLLMCLGSNWFKYHRGVLGSNGVV